jgi:hypothetical protein
MRGRNVLSDAHNLKPTNRGVQGFDSNTMMCLKTEFSSAGDAFGTVVKERDFVWNTPEMADHVTVAVQIRFTAADFV